jgi:hypothetical protein
MTKQIAYTAVHWLGTDRLIEHFEAGSRRAALEAFGDMGWNAYDDRKLFAGHKTEQDINEYEARTRSQCNCGVPNQVQCDEHGPRE